MQHDKDIRLIIRPGRRVRVREMGVGTWHHILAIVDEDQVVVKFWPKHKRRWFYKVISMDEFDLWYRNGRLS